MCCCSFNSLSVCLSVHDRQIPVPSFARSLLNHCCVKQVTIRPGCHAKVSSSKPVKPNKSNQTPKQPSQASHHIEDDFVIVTKPGDDLRFSFKKKKKKVRCQGSEIYFTLILAMTWQLLFYQKCYHILVLNV